MEIIFFKEIKVIEALKKAKERGLVSTYASKATLETKLQAVRKQLQEIIDGLESSEEFVGVIRKKL